MDSSILNNLGFDPVFIILGLVVLVAILAILVIVLIAKTSRLAKKYDRFMRGRDAESLEDVFAQAFDDIHALQAEERATKDALKVVNKVLLKSFHKTGLVKYDAFPGMGGKSSFALALMSQNKSGYILNAVHSRDTCYVYVKEIIKGETDAPLGREEEKAVRIALGLEKPEPWS
ncbi:DUF4446 family protein [Fusibacillus kribbianus]|uniref:DUF4446 family protein n=1 Tax=Fusibacillus kribbianus TaxID=3044208 RepID=A0AAP4BE24_9FIRM|nr:DUF4446 family protein [Ruminococcus sp. YH-rum2234]MDI9242704.1 DUF4446 family protein [Ruminococcus sp. YH-rum2234]